MRNQKPDYRNQRIDYRYSDLNIRSGKSVAFIFLGLVGPILLKPIQKIWVSLTSIIGWLITRVILLVLFYFVITPIGILARMFGKDFLDIKFDRNEDSYWIAREAAKFDKRSYENQY